MKPFVTLEFPDKPRRLRFGINALCEIEDVLGKPLTELSDMSLGVKEVRMFLYAAFCEEEPDITPKDVGNLMDEYEGGWAALAGKIGEAVALAFGGQEEKNDLKPVAKKAISGKK
jgi:hypothetical protein